MEQPVAFTSRDGVPLVGRLHLPAGPGPHPAVVVCHPHPLAGGCMDDPRVLAVVRALLRRNVVALRINFREQFDEGRAEQGDARRPSVDKGAADDVAGALDFLTNQPVIAVDRLALAGYSFGAAVVLHQAPREPRIRALALIAPPGRVLNPDLLAGFTGPVCIVVGDRDHISPAVAVRAFAASLAAPTVLHILPGTDHFFNPGLEHMADLVADFLAGQVR